MRFLLLINLQAKPGEMNATRLHTAYIAGYAYDECIVNYYPSYCLHNRFLNQAIIGSL
jgi:hypothetical protein